MEFLDKKFKLYFYAILQFLACETGLMICRWEELHHNISSGSSYQQTNTHLNLSLNTFVP